MEYSFYDFLKLLGSLGLFLYGMKVMSEGLQKVAGDKLRGILSAMTTNRVMGVFTGVMITALVQSSSATTVMVVSFVNAGLLSLTQSVSVIMGANVGTTVTAWIISIFGFKVNISAFSLPLIGLSLPLLFSKRNKKRSWGEFLIGFAFLFMGLDFLKAAVPDLQSNPEMLSFLQKYTDLGYTSVFLFMLVGSLLTVMVQSSSATVAITLIMCSQGWITFEIAAAMVLGENIGTTITANVAAFSANVSARRAAMAHMMFNVFGVLWMLALFFPFTRMVSSIVTSIGPGDPHAITQFLSSLDPETIRAITSREVLTDPHLIGLQDQLLAMQTSVSYALSLFHTMFNILNICIMIWFVNVYVNICTRLIKSSATDEEFHLRFISSGMLSTAELSIMEAKNEVTVYAERTLRMFGMVKELNTMSDENNFLKLYGRIEKYEQICDRMEIEIGNYLNKVSEGRLSSQSKEMTRDSLRAVTEIESIGDSLYNLAQTIKKRNDAKSVFTPELQDNIDTMCELVDKALLRMIAYLKVTNSTPMDPSESYNIENEINILRTQLKANNMEDVDAKKYDYQVGVYYMDFISECEKLGDYVMNVIEAYMPKGTRKKQ